MKKKRLSLENAIKKVNNYMRSRKTRIYDWPDIVENNKTGKKCRVCKGELLKEFKVVSNDVIGPGHRSRAEVCGYYCSQCGIRYKNFPKQGTE